MSDSRGPLFESNHQQNYTMNIVIVNCCKYENKKEAGNGAFQKINEDYFSAMAGSEPV